jgi:hypothetical protein
MTISLFEPVYKQRADKKIIDKKNVSQERNVDKNNGSGELERIVLTGPARPGPATPTVGPVINADAIREWKIKDCTARRILLTTIELKLQNTLVGCKTAFQIWTRLNSQHNKCAANNKCIIQRSFLNHEYQMGKTICCIKILIKSQ